MDEKYYTVKEVASQFRVSRQAVYDWIEAGKLRAIRVGDRVRISESALREFIQPVEPGDRGETKPGPWAPAMMPA